MLFQSKTRFIVYLITISFVLISNTIISQNSIKPIINADPTINNAAKKTEIRSADKLEILRFEIEENKSFPTLIPQRPKLRDEYYYLSNFKTIKSDLDLIYTSPRSSNISNTSSSFFIRSSSNVNIGDKTAPLDNTVAVSSDNTIVSITNNIIEYYDANMTLIGRSDLSYFVNYEIPSPCDPKVVFDPDNNKFIIFIQRCDKNYANSEIIIAFSQTSDPTGEWNLYKLSGNPLKKNGHWFDFPKIALSKNDLFISGNMFHLNRGFKESVVYQIDKAKGYSGNGLDFRVWYDFAETPFTIKPVGYSRGYAHTHGIYLLSTSWNVNGGTSDTVKLYDITGDLYNANATVNFYRVPVNPYRFFAEAVQMSKTLDNGDIRLQDALCHEDNIYYVFTSGNRNNFSRINFNLLNLKTLQNQNKMLGNETNVSYAYPSLHFLSEFDEPHTVFIQYNGSSNKSFPDIRGLTCDSDLNCTEEVIIKKGESTIDTYNRWGDYSTVAKNFGDSNTLVMVSSFGKANGRQSYLAQIGVPEDNLIGIQGIEKTTNMLDLDFALQDDNEIEVFLLGKDGTSKIYEGIGYKGENKFQISTDNLPKGNYSLEILNKNAKTTYGQLKFKMD